MIDAIDKSAGLVPEDDVYRTRRFRPEFVEGAALCRQSVLSPEDDQALSPVLRLALAYRMAVLNQDEHLTSAYAAQLAEQQPDATMQALAKGETALPEPLAALARHVDFITLTPGEATETAVSRLTQAGFTNGQIVALSELIAFVNFETRIVSGLRLMRSL